MATITPPLMATMYQRLYTDFLSEGLIFVYQQPHHRIIERWYRKAALESFNTIAINVLYIDRVEALYNFYGHTLAQELLPGGGVIKFTILLDPSMVIITVNLVCLIFGWE